MNKKAQKILKYLDSIEDINCGGCGIAALAFYRWCRKNKINISDRPFVFLTAGPREASRNERSLENGNIYDIEAPAHVVIELNGTLYDTSGCCGTYEFCRQQYQLDESELITVINNTGTWNSWFSRETYVPEIIDALDIDLSDVEGW